MKLKRYLINKYKENKEYLLAPQNRRKNLTITAFLIVFDLTLLIFTSNAYYYGESSLVLLHSIIGDFNLQSYDYVLKIYVEDINITGEKAYKEVNSIPVAGYAYSGYNCKNDSTLEYDTSLKETSVTIDKKEECSVYFDFISDPDITININVEEEVNSNTYKIIDKIPPVGYTYNFYVCENNSLLTYDGSLHKITTNAVQKDICNVYFHKITSDINVNLFIENNLNSNTYTNKKYIPSNINYSLNSERTKCVDKDNNDIDASISYTDGMINIETNEISYCSIYLDVQDD